MEGLFQKLDSIPGVVVPGLIVPSWLDCKGDPREKKGWSLSA